MQISITTTLIQLLSHPGNKWSSILLPTNEKKIKKKSEECVAVVDEIAGSKFKDNFQLGMVEHAFHPSIQKAKEG